MNMNAKFITLVSVALFSVGAFAQKEELKTLKKIYAKDIPTDAEMMEYKAAVNKAAEALPGASESDKVYIEFYRAMTPIVEMANVMAKPENASKPGIAAKYINPENIERLATVLPATLEYEKKTGKKVYTADIEETITSFSPDLFEYARLLGNANKYKESARVLYSLYQLNKKNPENLYYAANFALNDQDYDQALKYYNELK